ncbi:MAG TPA: oligosaccharide flippase family protein [Pedobacter sp.]|nr:oligosaccharide flippase family protein [Pedobacter sp.]
MTYPEGVQSSDRIDHQDVRLRKEGDSPVELENLKRSTVLNSVSSVLDVLSKLIVGFVLNPFIVASLGATLFGVWQVISQLNSYMATADVQAGASLKFILAKERTTSTEFELKKAVSCALYSNLFFLPLFCIVGALVVWFAPILSKVTVEQFPIVRGASALLVSTFVVTQMFFLYESTLHGMNLNYKRIGIRAVIIIMTGIGSAVVLYAGWSIIGLALVQFISAIVIGLSFVWIVKSNIPWFGFVKVEIREIIAFVKVSGWFMLMKFAALFNSSIDMILLGYFAGPKFVAAYAISKYAVTAGSNLITTALSAGTIGLGKFIGERNFEKIVLARKQFLMFQWVLFFVFGTLICMFNRSFIGLWTNKELFSGQLNTLLIVIVALLNVIIQFDGSIINITLNLKRKILFLFLSATVTVVCVSLLVPIYQTTGLLVGMICGNLVIIYGTEKIVASVLISKNLLIDLFLNKKALITVCMLLLVSYFSRDLRLSSWLSLALTAVGVCLVLAPFIWFIMINKMERHSLLSLLNNFKKKKV